MRISDWSSDVCSSDLAAMSKQTRRFKVDAGCEQLRQGLMQVRKSGLAAAVAGERQHVVLAAQRIADERGEVAARADFEEHAETILVEPLHGLGETHRMFPLPRREFANRSEEHKSELQSLMRSSYAVF